MSRPLRYGREREREGRAGSKNEKKGGGRLHGKGKEVEGDDFFNVAGIARTPDTLAKTL